MRYVLQPRHLRVNYRLHATAIALLLAVLFSLFGLSSRLSLSHFWAAGGNSFERSPAWQQNFANQPDGTSISKQWNFVTGTFVPSLNNEAETYTNRPGNARIENGALTIEAKQEHLDARNYTSAYLTTQGKFAFTYGKLTICMKLPTGVGTWPAAWLWPDDPRYTLSDLGLSPHDPNAWILNGELDIAEGVGSEPGQVFPSAHTYDQVRRNPKATLTALPVPDDNQHYHCYGIEKTPTAITFTLDDRAYYTVQKPRFATPTDWPFDQPYYLIINLAMGGSWGGELRSQFPPYGINNQNGPWQLEVRSISYYPLAPEITNP